MNVATFADENLERLGEYERLVVDGETWTNRQLHDSSCRLAGGLSALGLGRNDRIAMMLPNCAEVLITTPAVWRIGATLVPLMPDLRPREIANCLRHCSAKAIVTTTELYAADGVADALAGLEQRILIGETVDAPATSFARLVESGEPLAEAVARERDDMAVILYTGGTTGRPKGVIVTHHNLRANALNNSTLDTPMVELAVLPMTHSYGLGVLIGNYLGGGKTVLMQRFEPERALALIEEQRIEKMLAVPTMLISMMHHPSVDKYDTSSMRLWGTGGAPMSAAELKKFRDTFSGDLGVAYGMTEAGPTIARTDARPGPYPPGSCGVPIPGVEVRIVDDHDEPTPAGDVGEICVRSEAVSPGYLDDPSETARSFRDGWLYTGDLGRQDKDGYLYVVGRKKDVIVQGGFNVYPADVEDVIGRLAAVRECAVVGVADDLLGEAATAYIALRSDGRLTESDVGAHCEAHLAAYKLPMHYVFVDELPRTEVGKVDRLALRARPLERTEDATEPSVRLEDISAGIGAMFARLLGVKSFSAEDDFFELGGTSTNATRLLAWVQQHYSVKLKLRTLFEEPTVEALATRVRDALAHGRSHAPTHGAPVLTMSGEPPVTAAEREQLSARFGELAQVYGLTSSQDDDFRRVVDDNRRVTADALHASCVIHNLTFKGDVDPVILRQASEYWFARNEGLRGVFVWEDLSQPVLVIPKDVELPYIEEDLRGMTPAEQAEARRVREAFDPVKPPWMVFKVLRVADDEYWIGFHHFKGLLDGRSLLDYRHELVQTYGALLAGREPDLPPHRPLSDYFGWVAQQDMAQAEAYWRGLLPDLKPFRPPAMALPIDEALMIPKEGLDVLVESAQELGMALGTVLLASFALAYSHFSGERHVVIACLDGGRPAGLGLDGIISSFTVRFPLVARIDDPSEKVGDWFRRLQLQLADARTFPYALTERAMESWWGLPKGQMPGYDIGINLQRMRASTLDDLARPLPFDIGTISFASTKDSRIEPFSMSVWIFEDEFIRFLAACDSDHFEPDRAELLLSTLTETLEIVMEDPDQSIADVFAELDG